LVLHNMAANNDAISTDVVVIGAGPVGMYQAFQLGLLGLRCHVIDALPYVGGQTAELYPDKPIYDIPGIPVCSGQELAQALLKQMTPLGAVLHLGQTVTQLERNTDGFVIGTQSGLRLHTRALVIAAGAGSFEPRKLNIASLQDWEGIQVFYRASDLPPLTGKRLIVCGGEDAAVNAALDAVGQAASVTLVHRRDVLKASPEALQAWQEHVDCGRAQLVTGLPTEAITGLQGLHELTVTTTQGTALGIPCDVLLVSQGLSPRLGAITQWGLDIERKQLKVDTQTFATSESSIFAVGDIVTYPGKKRLIVCGFHEAVMAAYAVAAWVQPDIPQPLQYTTTSTQLQQRLGVLSCNK
jgi:thioredoxin reductase (NADPH)